MTTPQPPASAPRPFAAAPDPSRYFPATAIEEARQRVARSIVRGEGPALVIGASGLGKTILLEVLAQQFQDQLTALLLAGGQLCTRRALYQMILFQLGQPYKEMDETELRLALLAELQPQPSASKPILLLVDEADALPQRLLEELRSLTNLSASGQLLVHLVLAGAATLEEHFADPKLERFSQRISARCYLAPLGREETFQFVRAQVIAAGNDPQALFTDDALEAIFAATDGAPRLINQLGDQLMWMVAETGYAPLDSLIVQQAWSELQQLPAPWNTQSQESLGGAVEFGELPGDDGDDGDKDEIVFEDDSYESEYDDDRPASIPIYAPPADVEEPERFEQTDAEAIDVTEQLLQQLNDMDGDKNDMDGDKEETAPDPVPTETTRNPFDEPFESEEIVLDQYSTFESLLLAEAPRVVNRTDTAFAQQLQQLEVTETVFSTTEDLADQPETVAVDAAEPTTADLSNYGDVLVIEDNAQPQTTVVEGQQFRQLFSSLEAAASETRFG
ncbi:MAG: ExeA family protein [Bythopirellula sp.]